MFPSINRAEFRILLIDSTVWAKTVGPMDISRQYSTVATHSRNVSAPYAGSFFLSYEKCQFYTRREVRETVPFLLERSLSGS